MKVIECFERALGFLPEEKGDDPSLLKFVVPWTNQLLADTFEAENAIRESLGEPSLASSLFVSQAEEEIPYHSPLVEKAFPYGMARWLFREDDDVSGSREYYSLFVAAVAEATPYRFGEVRDVYREEETE